MLADALKAVLSGTLVPDEIIVVDQSDKPNEELSAFVPPLGVEFKYFKSETVGLSHSRNIGFAIASNEIIAVTDDDCLVAKTWLATIVESLLAAGGRSVVTGRALAGEAEDVGAFAPSLHTGTESVLYTGKITSDPLATFNFALHSDTFRDVGQFDTHLGPGTKFPSSEDNDYGYRLLTADYRIIFVPEAVVYHRAWRSRQGYIALRYAYGRGQGGYYGKHLASRDWYMVVKFWYALRRRITRMREGDLRGVLGELAWITGFVVGLVDWLLSCTLRQPSNVDGHFHRSTHP